MNSLINTTLALALVSLMSPALALDRAVPVSTGGPDPGSELLEREIGRLGRQPSPLSQTETDLASADSLGPNAERALLVSRKDKDRDHGHYAPPKRKERHQRHDDHGRYSGRGHRYDYERHHDHGHHRDYGHRHHYYPRHHRRDDRYFGGLNLIFLLDG